MNDKNFLSKLVSIRRDIHKHPELGHQEFRTSALIQKHLKAFRIPCKRLHPTGLVAEIVGNRPGRTIALRADMDALPIQEQNKTSYASSCPGVMHACGHDAHVAMLLGTAMRLSQDKNFPGRARFLFQPNEEGSDGAKQLIRAGALKGVDSIFGLHVNPRLPLGILGIKEGPLMAAVDRFEIDICGEGGHAAYPHEGCDPIPIASEFISALQTIVSRRMSPLDSCVITVGTLEAGTRYNILAEKVTMTGTVRTLSEKVHARIPKLIQEIGENICRAHGAKFNMRYERLGSILSNASRAARQAAETAKKIFGSSQVVTIEEPSMGGEDFAEYLKEVPGCFVYIGCHAPKEKNFIPWHHPQFHIDERVLPIGARYLEALVRNPR